MNIDKDIAATQATIRDGAERNFARFMDDPGTKLLISLIPEVNPPEVVATLLRKAFDQGHATGMADTMVMVMKKLAQSTKD